MLPHGPKERIAILISGSGTNMLALAKAVASGELNAEIVFVGSDMESAAGLDKARHLGLETRHFSYKEGKENAERAIIKAAEDAGVRWIVLAGYMRILSPAFVRRFKHRIINIHPSLLPSFPGAHGIEDAWKYGVKITGVTIHEVDELVDHGAILAQEAVEIADDDTLTTLEEKIHRVEHKLYKATLKRHFDRG